ncbi:MAG: NAD-dependent epimerase/dehydratase family protein [Candidatus Omnitrophica bacterium]|nr:NAD-dependent epimerase/dehydratase family protein [Candidatus Omnitrophota bacterium]
MNKIVEEDCAYVAARIDVRNLAGRTIVITGAAGFLGYNFIHQLAFLCGNNEGPSRVLALDNYRRGRPAWLEAVAARCAAVEVHAFDVVKDDLSRLVHPQEVDYVVHLASIASPTFYRQYPLETIDANVWGLRKLLDLFKGTALKGFLFYSSSEIYGDPSLENIPTSEDYRGNVACIGPRSCYDESKRFGETLCYYYHGLNKLPIRIVRPFNNYGPGMSIDDKRVVADFAKAVVEGRDIEILSSGSPARTFCYVADAMVGYWKALFYSDFDVFNIGIEKPEIAVAELANIYQLTGRKILGYSGKIVRKHSDDPEYLKDNPQRRCPDISKARRLLEYDPGIDVRQGVERYLAYLKEEHKG